VRSADFDAGQPADFANGLAVDFFTGRVASLLRDVFLRLLSVLGSRGFAILSV
jgi:hypothetical protein